MVHSILSDMIQEKMGIEIEKDKSPRTKWIVKKEKLAGLQTRRTVQDRYQSIPTNQQYYTPGPGKMMKQPLENSQTSLDAFALKRQFRSIQRTSAKEIPNSEIKDLINSQPQKSLFKSKRARGNSTIAPQPNFDSTDPYLGGNELESSKLTVQMSPRKTLNMAQQ